MEKKKLTVMIEGFIYDAFAGKCKANNFKISEVIIAGVAECDALIDIAKAKREKITRGWLAVLVTDALIPMFIRQTNYSPYYIKISADARVNYSLTTTLIRYQMFVFYLVRLNYN